MPLIYFGPQLNAMRLLSPRSHGGGAGVSVRELHPFGEEITVPRNCLLTPADCEGMKFTGHERDSESLDYMNARYYDPNLGRFLSVDPVLDQKKALKEPQRWNRYAYVITTRCVSPTLTGGKCARCVACKPAGRRQSIQCCDLHRRTSNEWRRMRIRRRQ